MLSCCVRLYFTLYTSIQLSSSVCFIYKLIKSYYSFRHIMYSIIVEYLNIHLTKPK